MIRQLATGQTFVAYEVEIHPRSGGAVLRVDGLQSGGEWPDVAPGEFESAEVARTEANRREQETIGREGGVYGRCLTWVTHP